jgi:hypothetical protein
VRSIRRAPLEAAVLGALFLAYKAVRLAVAGRVEVAFHNAHHVLGFERDLHLAMEHGLQKLVLHSTGLIVALNRYYVSMHFMTMAAFLLWLFFVHRDHYPHVRRLLVASTAIALLIHTVFPLAPPRMLPGFVDTMARYGPNAYASAQVRALANQHAAMPSVHFMWAVIVAYGVIVASSSRFRWIAIVHPFITFVAIVATANHFWLDAAVGGGLVALVLTSDRKVVELLRNLARQRSLDGVVAEPLSY